MRLGSAIVGKEKIKRLEASTAITGYRPWSEYMVAAVNTPD
jgi:hypothetical protein